MGFEEKLEKLKAISISMMGNGNCAVHDWGHIMRVYSNAEKLHAAEGGDWEIIAPAVLLHDCVRPVTETIENDHASASAAEGSKILEDIGFEKVDEIVSCILKHSSSSSREKPSTIEEKIVWDADKMDGFGMIGVSRVLIMSGERGWGVKETADNWLKEIKRIAGTDSDVDAVLEKWLFTETARKASVKDALYFVDFFKKIGG